MPVPVRAGTLISLRLGLTHPGTILITMSTSKQNQNKVEFTANNSRITTPSGQQIDLHIDQALIEFFENNPSANLLELGERFDYLLEQVTAHLPDDYDFKKFKQINNLLKGTSAFFYSLSTKVKDESIG